MAVSQASPEHTYSGTTAAAPRQAGVPVVVDLDSITGGVVPTGRDIEIPEGLFDWLAALEPPVACVTKLGSAALPDYYNWLLEGHAGWYRMKHPDQPVHSMGIGFREAVEGETLLAWAGPTPAAPTNVDVPHVGPDPAVVGNTLTCTMGNWTGAPTSYSYRWTDGAATLGSGATHLVTTEDQGKSLSCVVTATNPLGVTEAPPSNAVAIAAAVGASAARAPSPSQAQSISPPAGGAHADAARPSNPHVTSAHAPAKKD
jgi:hypothetical protein